VGLFPPEEPLAHVTALWQFPVMFYPTVTPCQDHRKQKIKLFY